HQRLCFEECPQLSSPALLFSYRFWGLPGNLFLHQEQKVIFCIDVSVERHGGEAEFRCDSGHGHGLKPLTVGKFNRRIDNSLDTELTFGATLRIGSHSPGES